tara:strand:- start:33 stop:344 length:312 start_codon:yes stop_codon:yes gene_type:complete
MNKLKFLNFIVVILFLASCGSVKSGFKNPKKDNSDEFLVEKKMPLKMPPAFNKLPTPSQNNQEDNNGIKSLISNTEDKLEASSQLEKVNKNLKESLLEKIKKN